MTAEYGRLLKGYIVNSGKSVPEVAGAVGHDPSHLRKMIKGTREPSPEKAQSLAEVLEVPINKRAEFFLSAAGFPSEVIASILDRAAATPTIGVDSVKTTHIGKRITVEIELT